MNPRYCPLVHGEVMRRHEQVGIVGGDLLERLPHTRCVRVEEARWEGDAETEGKCVAHKEDAFCWRIEPDVAIRVSRQRDDLQASPERKFVAIVNPGIHAWWTVLQQPAAEPFQRTTHARYALIGIAAFDV